MPYQIDPERERQEARLKAQLDENTRIRVARMEGFEEGRKQAWQIGFQEGREEGRTEGLAKVRVIFLIQHREQALQQAETPLDDLFALSLADLNRRADELQALAKR